MRGADDPTDANAGEPVTAVAEVADVVDRDGHVPPLRIVVLGVAGSGKSSVGRRLAERLGTEFVDGDSLHSEANVAKMAAGTPLVDADRWPWLTANREVLRRSDRIVLACSGLRRDYRNHLRGGGDVRFVYLDLDPATAEERAASRSDHFMGSNMIVSQFETLERPAPDERDVLTVDATAEIDTVVRSALDALPEVVPGTGVAPILAVGGPDHEIDSAALAEHVAELTERVVAAGHRRVLLVPPDQTRAHSRAGAITLAMADGLRRSGCDVGIMPALGTHVPMDASDADVLFGADHGVTELLVHDWRHGLRQLGEIAAAEVEVLTDGRFAAPIDVAVSDELFRGWDLVVSIGQVVPHEVIGMANFTKNLMIGLGGAPTIHRSHFVGAVAGMERIMGRVDSPVRDIIDAAFDRFLAPEIEVLWVLTVVADAGGSSVVRGLFAGTGGSADSGGAAFRAAATLAQQTNVTTVDRPLERVVCRLDPHEFRSTWLGNKAVYRTRMAIADGGELVVLAPGVCQFGEDEQIDRLIRKHGYRGTAATLAAVDTDAELAQNLSAAAHLIHGSSDGRFRIVYCTDPARGGLSKSEVEAVGFEWRPLDAELERLGVDADVTSGARTDRDGRPFYFVANPALGLWSTAELLDASR